MTRIEIDKSGDFARLAKDEEARFIKRGRVAVRGSVNLLRKTIRQKLSGPGSGRTYRFKGRDYAASAPGQPPARRSGRLQRGYQAYVRVNKVGGQVYGVVKPSPSTQHIARFLEFGTTKGKSKIAPRPFIRPATLETEPRINTMLREVVEGGET